MNRTLTLSTRRATLVFVVLIAVLVVSSELMFNWIRSTETRSAEMLGHLNEVVTPLNDIAFMADRLNDAGEGGAASLLVVMQREADQAGEALALIDILPETSVFRAVFEDADLQARQRAEDILAAIDRLNAVPISEVNADHPDVALVQTETPRLVADLIAYAREGRATSAHILRLQQLINVLRVFVVVTAIGGYTILIHYPLLDRVQAQAESLTTQVDQISRSEAALREQKSLFESVLRTTPGFVFVFDVIKNEITYASQPEWSFFGFDEQTWKDADSFRTFDFIVEEDRWKVINSLEQLTEGAESASFEARSYDAEGNQRWFQAEVVPFHVEGGTLAQILGTVTDVTELKMAYAEREQQARLLEQVTFAAPEIIYLLDTRTLRKIYRNIDIRELLGYPKDEWSAYDPDPFDHLIHPADIPRQQAHLARLRTLGDNAVLELEFRMRAADGTWRTMRSADRVFSRNALGEVETHVGVLHDITDWREAERRAFELRLERERMRINAEFIANSSHELRTPLTVVSSAAYIMSRAEDPAVRQSRLMEIEQQIVHLSKLVDDLQTLASLDAGPMHALTEIDLNSVIHDALIVAGAAEFQAPPLLDLASDMPSIVGDRHLLIQACRHVIQNASLFSPADQPIEIRTEATSTQVTISVTDHGSGIPLEDIPHVFDRFYKADKARSGGGTGLGLAMVKKIVEIHGGTVDVQSSPQGSTFMLMFAVHTGQSVERATPELADRLS